MVDVFVAIIILLLPFGCSYNIYIYIHNLCPIMHSNIPINEDALTFLAAPSRVSGVTLTKTVEFQAPALRVTWTPPQSDLTISQYHVEYRRSGTTSWDNATAISVSSLVTSTILTRLDAGTEYTVRVRAVSAVGRGNWSVEQTGRTYCREFNSPSTSKRCLCSSGTYSIIGQVYFI